MFGPGLYPSNRSNPSVILSHKKGFWLISLPLAILRLPSKYIDAIWGVRIATHIDKYDGSMVTFHCNRHEDDKYIQKRILLWTSSNVSIRHIPEKHFERSAMAACGARHCKTDQQLHKVISKQKRPHSRKSNHCECYSFSSFGYDPLECPIQQA